MSDRNISCGLLALPNEILLNVFDLLPTKSLIPLTPTCHHFHRLVLRLIHNRLQIAASLDGQMLYMECGHPSAQYTASQMHCAARGTDGLDELLLGLHDEHDYVGHVKSTFGLYSRFQPQSRPPPFVRSWKHPAGDIPGSRTYRPPNEPAPPKDPDDIVSETVTVDAHDLFSQLQAFAYLGKREPTRGLLQSIQGVSEGTIRIWREWLSKQCESKRWSDGETIAIHHDAPASPIDKGKGRADSGIAPFDPTQDSSILWLNTRDNNLGIRLKVRERKWRRNAPVLFKSDIEVPVSYVVEFDEVFVRSMHLLLKLEEAQKMVHDQTGKAIVFGSFRG